MAAPKGPYKLITVNTAPERAKRLIGRVVENIKDRYIIEHIQNCESECQCTWHLAMVCAQNYVGIEDVKQALESIKPDLLVRHLGNW